MTNACPHCGGDVENIANSLSDAGYMARDEYWRCVGECGERIVYGKPVGDSGLSERDCPDCGGLLLVHLINVSALADGDTSAVKWKCRDCKYFVTGEEATELIVRMPGMNAWCTGYPGLVGEITDG